MKSQRALISIGSNIRPRRNLPRAVARLAAVLDVAAVSSIYASAARGAPAAPPFLNAAVAVDTQLDPYELKFSVLRALEAELGRVRGEDRNAPRPIDLDLVLYGDRVIDDVAGGLELPDPELVSSPHVAVPIAEIAPETRHPLLGSSLADIAAKLLGDSDIHVVAPPPLAPATPGEDAG